MASKVKTRSQIRNDRIRRENAAFDKLSPEEKRISIARDVIVQLELGKLIPDHVYASGTMDKPLFGKLKTVSLGVPWSDTEIAKDQEVSIKAPQCHVCGIGSLFVCAVKRADRLFGKDLGCGSDEDNIDRGDLVKYLKRFFTPRQLDSIEDAYEHGWGEVEDDGDRLKAIMQNIIANGGSFKTRVRPVQSWVMPGFKG